MPKIVVQLNDGTAVETIQLDPIGLDLVWGPLLESERVLSPLVAALQRSYELEIAHSIDTC